MRNDKKPNLTPDQALKLSISTVVAIALIFKYGYVVLNVSSDGPVEAANKIADALIAAAKL